MPRSTVLLALAIPCLVIAAPGDARHRHHHGDPGHGNCLRFNKTTGAVAGGVGGAVIGRAVIGGPVATVGGAAAGALAGHKLAHNGRKRCR
ncbi:MAG: hypothetical protein KGM49_10155 [Sphingomonadales bacterium]|nr:hypothetical protein [Sphingomonadales bacterium]